ncbi:MAG: tRNA (adenosine(37)-N6)-dimethylallyltransferase MiaA, partial [Gammaproteobacteria bacterium]
AEFRDDALREMESICDRGNTPLLVGGTMLYFRALERGLSELPGAEPGLRAELAAQAERIGWPAMHERLAAVDPAAAERIHPNDPQRIQRALEVYELSGQSLSELCRRGRAAGPAYRFLKVVLAPGQRELLYRRIEQRFLGMLEAGFLDEVSRLRARGDLHRQLPAMRAVGYRQAWRHLDGELSAQGWVQRAVIATRQYAKRQLTWLRAEPDAHWIDPLSPDPVAEAVAVIQKAGAAAT